MSLKTSVCLWPGVCLRKVSYLALNNFRFVSDPLFESKLWLEQAFHFVRKFRPCDPSPGLVLRYSLFAPGAM